MAGKKGQSKGVKTVTKTVTPRGFTDAKMKRKSVKRTGKIGVLASPQENKNGSGGRTRTYNLSVNSRPLCQLSYAGTMVGTMLLKDSATAL